ncbi:MAG: XdhC family protein, partial [Pikeienuella sp.]
MAAHDRIVETALDWLRQGKGAALATVIGAWGSAPRPAGSQLAISSDAELTGSVSGGCVEGAVVAEAMEALADGQCRVLEFGVSDEEAFAVGLACGGEIRVMVEPVGLGRGPARAMIDALAAARAERRAAVYPVPPATRARRLVMPGADDPLAEAAAAARRADRSGFAGESGWFLGVHNPPLKMA